MRRSLQGVDFIPAIRRNGQVCAQYGLSTKLDSFVKMGVGQGILVLETADGAGEVSGRRTRAMPERWPRSMSGWLRFRFRAEIG